MSSIWLAVTIVTSCVAVTALALSIVQQLETHDASQFTSGVFDTARLGSGTANTETFLRGDRTWATGPTTSITGPTGAASSVAGPTGATGSSITGPTGPSITVAGTASQVLVNGTTGTGQSGALTLTLPSSVSIGTLAIGTGLTLPTSGGTAASLDHYEEFSQTFTFAGIWAANQSVTGRMTRVGKNITLMLPAAIAVANAGSLVLQTGGTAFPARFRPTDAPTFIVKISNNSVYGAGSMVVTTSGTLTIAATAGGGNYTGSGNGGWDSIAVSWNIM